MADLDAMKRWERELEPYPAGTLLNAACGCTLRKRPDGKARLVLECDAHRIVGAIEGSIPLPPPPPAFTPAIELEPRRWKRWWWRFLCSYVTHAYPLGPMRIVAGYPERRCPRCGTWQLEETEKGPQW